MNLSRLSFLSTFIKSLPPLRFSPRRGTHFFSFPLQIPFLKKFSYSFLCLFSSFSLQPSALYCFYLPLLSGILTLSLAILSFTGTTIIATVVYPQAQAQFEVSYQDTEENRRRIERCPNIKNVFFLMCFYLFNRDFTSLLHILLMVCYNVSGEQNLPLVIQIFNLKRRLFSFHAAGKLGCVGSLHNLNLSDQTGLPILLKYLLNQKRLL